MNFILIYADWPRADCGAYNGNTECQTLWTLQIDFFYIGVDEFVGESINSFLKISLIFS